MVAIADVINARGCAVLHCREAALDEVIDMNSVARIGVRFPEVRVSGPYAIDAKAVWCP